jgi:hypothetical protein
MGWHRPPLTEEQILAWADAHHARTGEWPSADAGPVAGTPGEKWISLDQALRKGSRGMFRLAPLIPRRGRNAIAREKHR